MKSRSRLALVLIPLVALALGFTLWTKQRESVKRVPARETPDVTVEPTVQGLEQSTILNQVSEADARTAAQAPAPEESALAERSDASGLEVKLVCRRIAGAKPGAKPGAPVAGIALTYKLSGESNPKLAGTTDVSGSVRAVLPEAGKYLFGVKAASLPEGVRSPGEYVIAGVELRGISIAEHEVSEGGAQEFTLWLHDERTIRGSVVAPDGRPLAGVLVSLLATGGGMQRVHLEERTDLQGAFEFPGVFPIEYLLRIQSLGSEAERLAGCVLPPPLFLDGEDLPAAPFVLEVGRGDLTLVGRVVNEVGEPVSGEMLRCYYTRPAGVDKYSREARYRYTHGDRVTTITTDEDGAFVVRGALRHPLAIHAGSIAAMPGGRGKRTLARGPKTIRLDPAGLEAGSHDVGTIVVERSHTFEVSGRIELTEERFNRRRLKFSKLRLQAMFDEVERERLSLVQGWGVQHEPFVEYNRKTGAFTVSCDTPRERITLHILVSGKSTKQFEFFPTPNGTESDVVLQFP